MKNISAFLEGSFTIKVEEDVDVYSKEFRDELFEKFLEHLKNKDENVFMLFTEVH